MNPTIDINEQIDIIAVFRKRGRFTTLCMPRKMIWRGQEVAFTELALRHPTVQGKRMIHVFHMSDGANGYRIEFDSEQLTWKLIAMIPEAI